MSRCRSRARPRTSIWRAALVREAGGFARIVAKIERHEAIDNLGEIIDASDVVMVARGDLGVEMGYAELTGLQKTIIQESRTRNRVVITATQMMESMIQNPLPTRAEVSDVANAVMDGTDAVMLSAETAAGRYPVKAVQAMAQVIEGAEKYQLTHPRWRQRAVEGQLFKGTEEAIAMAVIYTANHMKLRAVVALTESGETPLWMSRIRSDIPVYAFTKHEATRRRVTLYRGVYPVIFDVTAVGASTAALYRALFTRLLELRLVNCNDLVILTKGEAYGVPGWHQLHADPQGHPRLKAPPMRKLKVIAAALGAHRGRAAGAGVHCPARLAATAGRHARAGRPQRPGAHQPRRARGADHRGQQPRGPGLRHRLPACAGSLLRDGPVAPPGRR